MMRVLVVTHFYPPEVGAPQARLSSFARTWAAEGEQVTVLTGFPHHPTGVIPDGYRGRLRVIEDPGDVRVARTWVYATPNERILRRTISHLSFMVSGLILGTPITGKQDVVVVSSPTFFSIFSAWAIARVRRARFVVEVRDLWPSFAVELGVLRNAFVIRLLRFFELLSYRAADAIVAVSRGIRDEIVARGIDASKVHLIPNGVDMGIFTDPTVDRTATRQRLGASPNDFLVVYTGAHGVSYALEDMIDVAVALRDERVHFAFVGEGPTKKDLEQHVRESGLTNMTLAPSVPHGDMPAVLAAADACVVPDRDLDFLKLVIRAKIFEYMAAGRPVIGAVRGETADILTEAGQIVVAPLDRDAIVAHIRELRDDPSARERIGRTGRTYVATRFDHEVLARTYRWLLLSLHERET